MHELPEQRVPRQPTVEFSVIVPTHDRREALAEVLAALEAQQGAPRFEIVVVDDGSTDGTAEFLARRLFLVPTVCRRQPNRGPATARNLGVSIASGRWVALLGDDTVPAPDWLARHRAAHRARGDAPGLAVIGRTEWHPRMRVTPFLEYINEHGLQFGFSLIRDAENVPFNFFYTSNLSLERSRLVAEPFDQRFPYAAWEDIETSYRLFRRGLRLVYEPAARCAHDHPTSLSRFAGRQEKAGYSAVVFAALHPEISGFVGLGSQGPPPVPPNWPQRGLEILARALQFLPCRTPRLWERVLRFHYVRGLHRGWAERERYSASQDEGEGR